MVGRKQKTAVVEEPLALGAKQLLMLLATLTVKLARPMHCQV